MALVGVAYVSDLLPAGSDGSVARGRGANGMSCPPKQCTICMRISEAAAIKGAAAERLEQE
jgi:hypothetical protein